jgi:hypothetical protein
VDGDARFAFSKKWMVMLRRPDAARDGVPKGEHPDGRCAGTLGGGIASRILQAVLPTWTRGARAHCATGVRLKREAPDHSLRIQLAGPLQGCPELRGIRPQAREVRWSLAEDDVIQARLTERENASGHRTSGRRCSFGT